MEDSHIVEKILGCRVRKQSHSEKHVQNDGDAANGVEPNETEEFFVKYKNLYVLIF